MITACLASEEIWARLLLATAKLMPTPKTYEILFEDQSLSCVGKFLLLAETYQDVILTWNEFRDPNWRAFSVQLIPEW